MNFEVTNVQKDSNGRMLILNCRLTNEEYSIVNVYCPNDQPSRKVFLDECYDNIISKCDSLLNLVVGGDFNSVVDDLDKVANVDKSSKHTLLTFIKNLDCYDIWRMKHLNEREYTFIDPRGRGH